MHDTMYITLIVLIAGMGTITNIGSPHDRLGAHDWSTRVSDTCHCTTLTEAPSSHSPTDCDQVKNAIEK